MFLIQFLELQILDLRVENLDSSKSISPHPHIHMHKSRRVMVEIPVRINRQSLFDGTDLQLLFLEGC